eukprot:TRINITY_DN30176_c0_g1_i2.p1 TRINITY_DN30176_c0_g1~~TRINITY_DN30176_c0_g1_i2.p1  ORF type:complete len:373 (+),score=65.63 TRINITY_DN30176_c0_g1_i2:81-1199(+)
MDGTPYFNAGRWSMDSSCSGSSSSASLLSSCYSDISTETSFSGIDDFPRRMETIRDFDAYFARRQIRVADRDVDDEGDDGFFYAIPPGSDSSSDDEGEPWFPQRSITIYDLNAYLARRQPGVVVGGGGDQGDGDVPDVARAGNERSNDDVSDQRRAELSYDLDEGFARRQTHVSGRDGSDQGDDEDLDGALARNDGARDDDGFPSDPRRTETMPVFHATFAATRQAHVVESFGGVEGRGDVSDALRRPLPSSSAANVNVSSSAASSHNHAKSDSLADAADNDTRRQSWTDGSHQQGLCFSADRSSGSTAAPEVAIAGAQGACEQSTGDAAALARSVQADVADEGLSARVTDVPRSAQRESVIAMARARRGQM